MQFTLPYQDKFVLPSGAGPGDSRIEIVDGEIKIYRLGTLVGFWDSAQFAIGADLALTSSRAVIVPAATPSAATALFLDPPDSGTLGAMVSAQVFADLINTDDTPYFAISGPRITATETGAPRIDLIGSNGAVIRKIVLAPNSGVNGAGGFVDIPQDTAKTSDLRLGNLSLGRGLVAQEILTSNSSGITGDSVTDMNLDNVSVIDTRDYEIHLHAMCLVTVNPGEWALEARVNGTTVGRFGYIDLAAGERTLVDGTVYWQAPATASTDDIDVFANEVAGTSTLTLEASASIPRTLSLKDAGKV